jgi:hypothetical protein
VSGVVATIELSRCSPYGCDQRFEVDEGRRQAYAYLLMERKTWCSDNRIRLMKGDTTCSGGAQRSDASLISFRGGFRRHSAPSRQVFGSEGMLQVANPPKTHLVVSRQEGIAHDNPMHSFPQR